MSARPHHIRIFLCEKRRDLTLLLKNGRETMITFGAFTLDVKSTLNVNLGGILGGTQCQIGDSLMLSEC
jgi:hypothetical protein